MTAARAYRLVRSALENGEIKRPAACSRCATPDRKPITGIHSIQGHHYKGYDYPLDLEWLCPKCHRADTPLPEKMGAPTFGERNGAAKLTASQADEIRQSTYGCRILSRRYGVDKKIIQRIRNGQIWKR